MPFCKYSGQEVNIVSEKTYRTLSGSDRSAAFSVTAQSPQKLDDEQKERKKRLRGSLIKFGSLAVFALIVWIFATASWFANSNSNSADGMGVSIGTDKFEITMLKGTDGIFSSYHSRVKDENALVWKMTADNNLINYNQPVGDDPGDLGLYPGTSGVISFKVTPKVQSVDLNFDFEVLGYRLVIEESSTEATEEGETAATEDGETAATEATQATEPALTALSDLPDNAGAAPQNLLNGHILLFERRSGSPGNYVYYDPILSNEDMHRIMNRTVTGKDSATQIDIYWVWPNTLSTLIDARAFPGISMIPFCTGTSYTKVKNNFEAYPQYYLKNYKGTAPLTDTDLSDTIVAHYDVYGDMYDQGDNEIGMSVSYLLIKLSVSEGTAVGGGP